jgi:hypothetical protein
VDPAPSNRVGPYADVPDVDALQVFAQSNTAVRVVSTGGMASWQITLIAAVAAAAG